MPYPELLVHPVLLPLWVMFAVVLLEKLWAWPPSVHPLTLVRLLAQGMARKVHPDTSRSESQQRLSGTLAIVVLVLLLLFPPATLIWLAEYPLFFEAFLLLISLSFQPVALSYDKVSKALANEKKALARDMLMPWVLRETDRLSPMGVGKAAIECLLLRFHYQYLATLFWYLLLGGMGAFTYRAIYELSQCWNIKQPRFRHFGKPVANLHGGLSWLPVQLSMLLFALVEKPIAAFRASSKHRLFSPLHTRILASAGGALGFQLGGPAFYDGRKIRLAKLGGPREVRLSDLPRTAFAVYKTQALFFALSLLICTALYAVFPAFA